MPYALRGTKVVKSDTGEVVKDHPTREKALRHLRALKANVEEGSPAVLGALLEGFDAGAHPRDFKGRWIAVFHHSVHGETSSPIEASSSAEASRKAQELARAGSGGRVHMTVQSVAPHDSNALQIMQRESGRKYDSLGQAARAGALPSQQPGQRIPGPTGRKFDSLDAAARAGALPSQQPTAAEHGGFKPGDVVRYSAGSRGPGGHGPVTMTPQPGLHTVVSLQRNGNLRLREPDHGTTFDVPHSHATKVGPLHPDYRGKVVQDAIKVQRAQIESEKAARSRGRAPNETRSDEMASGPLRVPTERDMQRAREAGAGAQGVLDDLTAQGWKRDATGRLVPPAPAGVGPEGSSARARGASAATTEHADTRDKLTNLPVGQRYGLHGPQGQIGHVERTAQGWKVTGPSETHDRVHKTPSSAAGHAMKLQRSAAATSQSADVMARNWRGRQEVAGMNARQAQRAEAARGAGVEGLAARSARERQIAGSRRLAALDEVVNFGGIPTTKGDVIAQLQREGHPQAYIDRYLQGLDRGRKVREAAPEVLGALLEGR